MQYFETNHNNTSYHWSYQDFTVAGKTFEITQWPQLGWRPLDPGTGDEVPIIAMAAMAMASEMCWNLVRLEPRKGTLKCNGRPGLDLFQENLRYFDHIFWWFLQNVFSPMCFKGDFFYGKNLAIATENNQYLDGLGALWLPQLTACSAFCSQSLWFETGMLIWNLWIIDSFWLNVGLRPELAETEKDADASGVPRVTLT